METELGQEAKYMRLIGDKVVYITAAEAMEEKVLAKPRVLTDRDIVILEWNERVKRAEQLKERAGFIHQAMREDDIRPSLYEPDYKDLWDQYGGVIKSLRELDSEWVNQFRDKVAAKIEELVVRINAMHDNWDPESFDDFEQILACYERNYDLMRALQKVVYGRCY